MDRQLQKTAGLWKHVFGETGTLVQLLEWHLLKHESNG